MTLPPSATRTTSTDGRIETDLICAGGQDLQRWESLGTESGMIHYNSWEFKDTHPPTQYCVFAQEQKRPALFSGVIRQ